MKNIIILGPSRSGKTTLSKKLNEELNYSIVCFDNLIYAFEHSFPQLGICHGSGAVNTASNIAIFLAHYLRILSINSYNKNGVKFAAEGGYFNFDKIIHVMNECDIINDFIFIGLVYNNKSPDELFNDIRKNDSAGDWSCNCDDDTLKHCANIFVEDSRRMYNIFEKYNFKIYDVSENREHVLNKVVNDIGILNT